MSPAGNPAKVVCLRARPLHAASLALETGGIVGELNVALGDGVSAFDFAALYASLGNTSADSPAQLYYDSQAIHDAAFNILALRAESLKAALDKAIAARANAFYGKYAYRSEIVALTQQYYSAASPNSKPQLLADLAALAQQQADALQAAYAADQRLGVVRTTTSGLTSTTQAGGTTTASGDFHERVASNVSGGTQANLSSTDYVGLPPAEPYESQIGTDTTSSHSAGSDQVGGGDTATTTEDLTTTQTQAISNTGYDYRVPSLENLARNDRAQISLIDEQFTQFMAGLNIPSLGPVLDNELAVIDLDVRRLQVAYLSTILRSPIDGVVTGIFTGPGDAASAGSVLVRVEDSRTIILEGTLAYRGVLALGSTATVATSLFGDPAQPGGISGTVVAAQGHVSREAWWDVSISCSNVDEVGNSIVPPHYSFGYDDTTVEIF